MFRQPNAIKEINKIQETIYKEEKKLTSKERITKIKREADALRKKYGIRTGQTA